MDSIFFLRYIFHLCWLKPVNFFRAYCLSLPWSFHQTLSGLFLPVLNFGINKSIHCLFVQLYVQFMFSKNCFRFLWLLPLYSMLFLIINSICFITVLFFPNGEQHIHQIVYIFCKYKLKHRRFIISLESITHLWFPTILHYTNQVPAWDLDFPSRMCYLNTPLK